MSVDHSLRKMGESRARSLTEFMNEKRTKIGFLFSAHYGVREKNARVEMPIDAVTALKKL